MAEWNHVLNPTFTPDRRSTLTKEQAWHINLILDQVQVSLAYINLMRGRNTEIPEKDIPYYMGCRVLEEKHSTTGGVWIKMQRQDVIFAIMRNSTEENYTFSNFEPEIADNNIPDPVQPMNF